MKGIVQKKLGEHRTLYLEFSSPDDLHVINNNILLKDLPPSWGAYSLMIPSVSPPILVLQSNGVLPLQFFRLRPPNFPTIRLSQLANLYHEHQNLFSKVIELNQLKDFYALFNVSTSAFWETHFTFQKVSKKSTKIITKAFTDLLLINTILPLKFCYAKQKGQDVDDSILKIASQMHSEKNSIIDAFNQLKKISKSAFQSQALIQLKTEYCQHHKCLQCAIGNMLLTK